MPTERLSKIFPKANCQPEAKEKNVEKLSLIFKVKIVVVKPIISKNKATIRQLPVRFLLIFFRVSIRSSFFMYRCS